MFEIIKVFVNMTTDLIDIFYSRSSWVLSRFVLMIKQLNYDKDAILSLYPHFWRQV